MARPAVLVGHAQRLGGGRTFRVDCPGCGHPVIAVGPHAIVQAMQEHANFTLLTTAASIDRLPQQEATTDGKVTDTHDPD